MSLSTEYSVAQGRGGVKVNGNSIEVVLGSNSAATVLG